jgi:transcription elongation factor Elf1
MTTNAPTERDKWTEQLQCPRCGIAGAVELSQATGLTYHDGTDQNVLVELAPVEFRVVTSDLGSQFHCLDCGALAKHK